MFSLRQPEGEDSHPDHFNDTIYNRLSILLKSVVAVSRALPAYKYARNQNCDSYVFMYQVYAHEPASSSLGKEYRSNSVGVLSRLHADMHGNVILQFTNICEHN